MSRRQVKNFIQLNIGLILLALVGVLAFEPARVTPGGVYSISMLLFELFGGGADASYHIARLSFILNIPLIAYSYVRFGRGYLEKAIYAVFAFNAFTSIIPSIINYYGLEGYRTEDPIVAAVVGGILMGICVGMAITAGGNTGGTDIVAQIINDIFPLISVGTALIIINALIILGSLSIFGASRALMSVLSIFLVGISLDGYIYLFGKK